MRKFYSVLRVQRTAIDKHACREFSIERLAKTFLDVIQTVMEGYAWES